MLFTQLWPERRELEVEDYVADLAFVDGAGAERPFTIVNFVSSVDGRATVHGRSGALGDDGDKALFRALRSEVDAVLVGTGTLGAERYGRLIRDPEVRERRDRRGLPPEPLACTVTRSGALPLEIPLFAEPEARIIVFTCADVDTSAARAQVEVVWMDPDQLSFARVLSHLRSMHDVRALLCEGGPRVFGALARERAFDQLFLTVAAEARRRRSRSVDHVRTGAARPCRVGPRGRARARRNAVPALLTIELMFARRRGMPQLS